MTTAWTTEEELLDLHHLVAEMFAADGDPMYFTGERERGLIGAAVNRPLASFGGRDLFKSGRERIAALIHAINSSHVFRDGNKRTSVAALVVLLDRDGWNFDASDTEIKEFMVGVASPAPPFDGASEDAIREMTAWIRARTTKKSKSIGDVDTLDFLNRCEQIGGSWHTSGSSYVLVGTSRSIRISRSTSNLAEGVVRSYLSTVGLSEAYTGVSTDIFIDGRPKNEALVRKYQEPMALLAAHDRFED